MSPGVIKTVLALEHGLIPPHLHLEERNPRIPWPDFPVVVPGGVVGWPGGGRRVAGVSAFGFSGTNAHVVVGEAPVVEAVGSVEGDAGGLAVVVVSARSDAGLVELAGRYGGWLEAHGGVSVGEVAATTQRGRALLWHRLAVVAGSPGELVERLGAFGRGERPAGVVVGEVVGDAPKVALLYTGQGSQYPGMGRGLYESQPVFRDALDHVAGLLDGWLDRPLLEVMFAAEGSAEAGLLGRTGWTQPALFALEWALTQWWASLGVTPQAVFGHSVGEFAAAVTAGVFSVEDGARLIAVRARLMDGLAVGGGMVTVHAGVDTLGSVLDDPRLAVAAVNGPTHTVLSGPLDVLGEVCDRLGERGVRTQSLAVSHAFHSPLMTPIVDEFARAAGEITYHQPRRRLVTNLTGTVAGPEIATPQYWTRQLTHPVRYAQALATLHDLGHTTFLEIGPHPTLTTLAQANPHPAATTWTHTLHRTNPTTHLTTLATLTTTGTPITWPPPTHPPQPLPTYPFHHQHHWIRGRRHRARSLRCRAPAARPPHRCAAAVGHDPRSLVAPDAPTWLTDHRLAGTTVLPGSAYIDMVLAATGPEGVVSSLTISDALVVEGEVVVQTVVTDGPDGTREVRVSSLPPSAAGSPPTAMVHASAVVRPGRAGGPPPVDLAQLRAGFADEIDVKDYYGQLREIGLTYGPSFQGLRSLWRRDGAALGRVTVTDGARDGDAYLLHPALLDACFHVLGAALAAPGGEPGDEFLVPVAFSGIRLHRPGADRRLVRGARRRAARRRGHRR